RRWSPATAGPPGRRSTPGSTPTSARWRGSTPPLRSSSASTAPCSATRYLRDVLCCVDVGYRPEAVIAAGVGFAQWSDARPAFEQVVPSARPAAPYEPGQFYRRELPYLVALVQELPALPDILVVDGYVWLGEGAPGLGAHLFEALDRRVAVVGIA